MATDAEAGAPGGMDEEERLQRLQDLYERLAEAAKLDDEMRRRVRFAMLAEAGEALGLTPADIQDFFGGAAEAARTERRRRLEPQAFAECWTAMAGQEPGVPQPEALADATLPAGFRVEGGFLVFEVEPGNDKERLVVSAAVLPLELDDANYCLTALALDVAGTPRVIALDLRLPPPKIAAQARSAGVRVRDIDHFEGYLLECTRQWGAALLPPAVRCRRQLAAQILQAATELAEEQRASFLPAECAKEPVLGAIAQRPHPLAAGGLPPPLRGRGHRCGTGRRRPRRVGDPGQARRRGMRHAEVP